METPGIDDLEREEQARNWRGVSANIADAEWPDPFPADMLPVPAFPIEALPDAVADMVQDVAQVTKVPPDLPALVGLGAVAAAGARRALVAIGGTHTEPLNLYTAPVAESGERKGPMLRAMLAPLYEMQREQQRAAQPEVAAAAERRRCAEKRLEVLRGQAAKANDPDGRQRLTAEAEALARELPPLLALPKLVVSDRTPEKLEQDLADQGGALLLASEEAGTLFAIAGGRYARDGGAQLDTLLKAYDGGEIDTDRITRGAVTVEAPTLSIIVTPQPFLLQQLRDRPEFHHRGLLPRFAFALPRSMVGERLHDRSAAPDDAVRDAYRETFRRLLALPKPAAVAEVSRLRIEGDALAAWVAYHDRLEAELRDGGRLCAIREWASKQPGRVARIAGALHLVVTVGGGRPWRDRIEARTVEAACGIGEYLEAHALVAYDVMRADPRLRQARAIHRWLRRLRATHMTERDALGVVSHGPERTMACIHDACTLLVDHGWLRPLPEVPQHGRGRPRSPGYAVHPRIAMDPDEQELAV